MPEQIIEIAKAQALDDPVKTRRRNLPWAAAGIIGFFVLLALLAPIIAPYSPLEQSLRERNMPPGWMTGGSMSHLLGTDKLGRDILSRIMFGTQIAFQVSFAALILGGGVGGILGLLAGYYRGTIDTFIMRIADGTMSFPVVLLALLFVVTLGPGLITVVLAIGIVIWAQFARLVRGEVLATRERLWVKQARINSCSDWQILTKHIVPHVVNTWVVMASLQIGFVILFEASLSFLGAGVPPPAPAWGQMVAEGRDSITTAWWTSILPAIAIMLLVLAFNMLGDWLREVLDPELRQV